jgi:uncharacterized protein (DUF849 family)
MIVQAALNGARNHSYHPQVPQSLGDLAGDVAAAIAAGAGEFHAHVYAGRGRESLEPTAVAEWVRTIRRVAPGALVGISTGGWIENDDERRLAYIRKWSILPDHASVNLEEPGAIDVIRALHARGVGIEAGISTVADAERLRDSGVASLVLRILVEVNEPDVSRAMAIADATLAILDGLPSPKPILMHGFDDTTWPFLKRAIAGNYAIRIGLEDTNALPDGTRATGNAELIRAAVDLINAQRAG